jgi:sarcosine oxidase gamma subunit
VASSLESAVIEVDGLSVGQERELQVASLRYFDPAGSFAAAVHETLGGPLPEPLRAIPIEHATSGAHFILAWRSPSETLLLCDDAIAFADLEQRLEGEADGCMVNQTGGLSVMRVRGPRSGDLFLRLGANSAIPSPGEARSSRLAELHVLAACVRAGEFLLVVERVYAHHLLAWMDATAADL